MADKASTILGIESHLGPAPQNWIDRIDEKTRDRISQNSSKPLQLDRWLQLAYDQDYEKLLDMEEDEEDFPMEEYEKPMREFTDEDLDTLGHTLRGLLTYNPASRGTPEALLRSPWFERHTALRC